MAYNPLPSFRKYKQVTRFKRKLDPFLYLRNGYLHVSSKDFVKNLKKARIAGTLIVGLVLLITVSRGVVYADNFYPSMENAFCNFAHTVSLSIGGLPGNSVGTGMTYNSDQLRGEGMGYPEAHNFTHVAEINYPNARRYLGVADRVSVPPNSKVDVGFYIYNYSGHTVDVRSGTLFLSRTNLNSGDISKIVQVGSPSSKTFLLNGNSINRTGNAISLGSLGSWGVTVSSNVPAGRTIAQFTTIQPMKVTGSTVSHHFDADGALIADMKVKAKNTSSYVLSNIVYQHGLFTFTRNYQAGEEFEYVYSLNLGKNYGLSNPLGKATIFDPNFHKECAASGATSSLNYTPNSRVMIVDRNDLGAPLGWSGTQADFAATPVGDYFCVELIPYTLHTAEFSLAVEPSLSVIKMGSDTDEVDVAVLNSQPGEVLSFDLEARNNGASLSNVSLTDTFDDKYLEVVESCGGEVNGNVILWSVSFLNGGEVWNCKVKFRIKTDLLLGKYLTSNNFEACYQSKCSNRAVVDINIDAWNKVEISKSVAQSTATEGEVVDYDLTVVVTGNIPVRNIELDDICEGCDKLVDLTVKQSDFTLGSVTNLNPGNYKYQYSYKVGELTENSIVQNCFTANYNNVELRECTELEIKDSVQTQEPNENVDGIGLDDPSAHGDKSADNVTGNLTLNGQLARAGSRYTGVIGLITLSLLLIYFFFARINQWIQIRYL